MMRISVLNLDLKLTYPLSFEQDQSDLTNVRKRIILKCKVIDEKDSMRRNWLTVYCTNYMLQMNPVDLLLFFDQLEFV